MVLKAKKTFPDNKTISAELNAKEELKKYQKKVMPFVAYLKEQANAKGVSALNSTLDFDEFDTLNINNKYLVNTLQVNLIILNLSLIIDSI